ncbi:hypothetical protein FF1_000599 [Malus domestica]|uniref:TF-B3 domain-containing protein n=1 Tax=Malus domestica TaxID=3750 RepID=A0A498KIK9_MALDO|nr:hypothetical protein DVH24_014585 [Malus domestica]
MLMSSRSLRRTEDLDDDDGLSPFDMLAKAICTIASRKIKLLQETQENSDLPLKKRRSYFDFLNIMPSPSPTASNTNTNPNSPKEGNGLVIVREKGHILESSSGQVGSGSHEEEEKSGNQQEEEHQPLLPNKKCSHSNIQEIPDLLEECCPHPKKPRSPTKAKSIILFGKELTIATDIPVSTRASGTELDYVHEAQTMIGDKDNLKRKYIDVDDGEDHVGPAHLNEKKKKVKFVFNNNLNATNKVVKKGKNKVKFASGMPAPDLPEEFKSLILGEMNGTKLQMLAQKSLYNTDINKDQGRLSLPRMQTESKNFLKPNEKEELDKTSLLMVPLIGPKLEPDKVSLGLWTMSSKSQKTYVLKSTWFGIVERHSLGVGDVVQVWSFRATNPKYKIKDGDHGDHDHLTCNDDQLHLALVLVERGDRLLEEGGSKEGGTSTGGVSSSMSNNECDEGRKTIDGSSSGSCTPENDGNSSPKPSCEERDQETFN